MTGLLAQLFVTPVALTGVQKLLLMFPLCLSIAIVYKPTRCERLRELPRAACELWITIIVGMFSVGAGLWIVDLLMT